MNAQMMIRMKRARLRAAVLVLVPVALWLLVALPFLAAVLLMVVVAAVILLLSQLIGPGLEANETAFWSKHGALPEVLMMRQRGTGNPKIRSLKPETIAKVEVLFGPFPTLEEEAASPQMADKYYSQASHVIRSHIKTCGDSALMRDTRLDYENKLNLWLLRKPGRWLAVLSGLMCAAVLVTSFDSRHDSWFERLGSPTLKTVASFAALCCCVWLACFWVFKVRRSSVFAAGVTDAETMFNLFAANPMPVLRSSDIPESEGAEKNDHEAQNVDQSENTEPNSLFEKLKSGAKSGWRGETSR